MRRANYCQEMKLFPKTMTTKMARFHFPKGVAETQTNVFSAVFYLLLVHYTVIPFMFLLVWLGWNGELINWLLATTLILFINAFVLRNMFAAQYIIRQAQWTIRYDQYGPHGDRQKKQLGDDRIVYCLCGSNNTFIFLNENDFVKAKLILP